MTADALHGLETLPAEMNQQSNNHPPQISSEQLMAKRIVLTGFMGSGKSTVGALLAERLGWDFVDLDTEIEQRCGAAVPALFEEFGETYFRKQEASALASLLGRSKVIIALGGGAPETLGNRLLLEQTPGTAVVFLDASFGTLHERCLRQGSVVRPLLADRAQTEARFAARQHHYNRIADFRVETGGITATQAVNTVLDKLNQRS